MVSARRGNASAPSKLGHEGCAIDPATTKEHLLLTNMNKLSCDNCGLEVGKGKWEDLKFHHFCDLRCQKLFSLKPEQVLRQEISKIPFPFITRTK